MAKILADFESAFLFLSIRVQHFKICSISRTRPDCDVPIGTKKLWKAGAVRKHTHKTELRIIYQTLLNSDTSVAVSNFDSEERKLVVAFFAVSSRRFTRSLSRTGGHKMGKLSETRMACKWCWRMQAYAETGRSCARIKLRGEQLHTKTIGSSAISWRSRKICGYTNLLTQKWTIHKVMD